MEHVVAVILLSYVFGWRASTTGALRVVDCTFLPDTDVFRFLETFCKGSFTNDRLFRILDLQHIALPGLSLFLHYFILQQPVFRLRYIKLMTETPELKLVTDWIKSNDEVDIEDLKIFCESNATKYFLNDSIWVTRVDIEEELPNNGIQIIDSPSKGLTTLNDENFIYLVFVRDFLKPGDPSPVDLVKGEIRSLILNKRKLELLKKMRKDIYSEAVRKKNVELFHNK